MAYEPAPISAYGTVSNDSARNELIAGTTDKHIRIRRINFSVYEAAEGGGGLFRIQTSEGTEVYTIDADETKDFVFDAGRQGLELPMGEGFEIIVFNAATKQASVSLMVTGFKHRWSN